MEKVPVFYVSGISPAPGTEMDVFERYANWVQEVYTPTTRKMDDDIMVEERYQRIGESLEYPFTCWIFHHKDLKVWEKMLGSPERAPIRDDLHAWTKRGVREPIWVMAYELVKGFRGDGDTQGNNLDTRIENVLIMFLEGFQLLPEEQEKYDDWLNGFGYGFIPFFMKLPGFKGYDFFKDTAYKPRNVPREREYPSNLSILYFDSLTSFEDYRKSHELVMFQKALRTVFPNGPALKWYVQYQLVKSWGKLVDEDS